MKKVDVVIHDTVSGGEISEAASRKPMGGSEYELLQMMREFDRLGISYFLSRQQNYPETIECKTLILSRYSAMPIGDVVRYERLVVKATDAAPKEHEYLWVDVRAAAGTLVCVSEWQMKLFPAHWQARAIVIPAMIDDRVLELGRSVIPIPNRWCYASAAMKGLRETIDAWIAIKKKHPAWPGSLFVTTNWDHPSEELIDKARHYNVNFVGRLSPHHTQRFIAEAEGLFYVNVFPECCPAVACVAAAMGRKLAIMCLNDPGGMPDAIYPNTICQTQDELEERMGLKNIDPYIVFTTNLASLKNYVFTGVSDNWAAKARKMIADSETQPLDEFLHWDTYLDMCQLDCHHAWYAALRASPDWESRWRTLSTRSPYGRSWDYDRDPNVSPNSVQHAYHLFQFEQATGKRFTDDVDAILEVGGGYGNVARMLHVDGWRGPYVIVDLPHVLEFQRLFLTLNGIPVRDFDGSLFDGVTLAVEEAIPAVLEALAGKKIAFWSTWALSETTLEFRAKFFPRLHAQCAQYLLASQWTYPVFEIDNAAYFKQFMDDAGGDWVVVPITAYSSEAYLFGVVEKIATIEGPLGAFAIPNSPGLARRSTEYISRAVWAGEYDHPELEGAVGSILDIGAGWGAFAVWARRKWPEARIEAYEPAARTHAFFMKNAPWANLIQAAVSIDPEPTLSLGEDWGSPNTSGLFEKDAPRVRVASVHPRDLPAVDLLKIDAEGVESEILENYPHMTSLKVCIYEWHSAAHRARCRAACEKMSWICLRDTSIYRGELGVAIWVKR